MKKDIHPEYKDVNIRCACGNVIETKSTKDGIHLEICSQCHPFFTGKQKFVDADGRIDKFKKKYDSMKKKQEEIAQRDAENAAKKAAEAEAKKAAKKPIETSATQQAEKPAE